MTDFSFPEKPNYNFTKEQTVERKKILKNKINCVNAKYLQSRILQFKTNYWDSKDALKQASILKKTIKFFE